MNCTTDILEWIKNADTSVIVSMYAAIISTMALAWNIATFILGKLSRLKVNIDFNIEKIALKYNDQFEEVNGPYSLTATIVNKSSHIKYIKNIKIRLPYKSTHGKLVPLHKVNDKFPKEIKPEEQIKISYAIHPSMDFLFEGYKENKFRNKFRLLVYDTKGEKYKSNKIKVEILKIGYDYNQKITSKEWEVFAEIEGKK